MTDELVHAEVRDLLRELRLRRGWTQEELAGRAAGGISVDTVSNIERGRVRPHRQTLLSLLQALEATPGDQAAVLEAWRRNEAGKPAKRARETVTRPLPTPLTPLIGREMDLHAIERLLMEDDVRLVTLTGLGGVGKTRLALAVAASLQSSFRDGAVLVDLTSLREPHGLLTAIASAVGLADFGDRPVEERLAAYLRPRRVLLVLDNCETAVEAAAQLTPVLEACPAVKVLATSRVPLRLRGEHEVPILPLPVPLLSGAEPEAMLGQVPAVALFLDRARAVSPGFEMTAENARAIGQVCVRLEGLPLAIELAASRMRYLTPEALLARLGRVLDFLVGGPRDLPERQRTLRATIDWSHGQLTDAERRVFRRLAVFVDGCSETAALSVCGDDESESAVLEALEGLLDKQLLRRDTTPAAALRVRMLETIREYAWEQLTASGETQEMRRRHAYFYRDLAEASFGPMYSAARGEWIEALQADYSNLREALAWALGDGGEAETGVRLAGALGRFWYFVGQLNEGRSWLSRALATTAGVSAAALGRAQYSAAKLAWTQGDFPVAKAHAEASVALLSQQGDSLARAEALTLLGYCLASMSETAAARAAYEQSIELERRLGADWQLGFSLAMASEPLRVMGDTELAKAYLEESASLFRRAGNPWGMGVRFAMTAGLLCQLGDLDGANEAMAEAEAEFAEGGNEKYSQARARILRGFVSMQSGRPQDACMHFAEALRVTQELGQSTYIMLALAGAGTIAALAGSGREAALLYGRSSPVVDSQSPHIDDGAVAARTAYAAGRPAALASLGQAGFDAVLEEGRGLSLDEAVRIAQDVLSKASGGAPGVASEPPARATAG